MFDDFIPQGKDILTRHGCKCLNEYKITHFSKNKKGTVETIKEKCVFGDKDESWCIVHPGCGHYAKKGPNKGKYWDKCLPPNHSTKSKANYTKKFFNENLFGVGLYILIFVIILPIIFFKNGWYNILEVYMPNFDLIATSLSYNNGPIGLPIFAELYNPKSETILGFISTTFINYLSLLGLTYIIARRVKITNSFVKGWSIGFVMLLLTYLIPNNFITYVQDKFSEIIFKDVEYSKINSARKNPYDTKNINVILYYLLIVVCGLFISSLFIGLEIQLLKKQNIWLIPSVKHLLSMPNILKK